MQGSDIENAVSRGVLFWWFFCILSESTILTGLRRSVTIILGVFILPLVYSRARRSIQNPANPARKKDDLLISSIASAHGFVQYVVTAITWPSISPLLKIILAHAILHLAILWSKRERDPEEHFRSMQWLQKLPKYITARLAAARQYKSPFVRFPALFLGYLALYAFVSITLWWGVNYALPQAQIPRFRLLQRRLRLSVRSWLFHQLGGNNGPMYRHSPLEDDLEKPRKIRLLKLLKRRPFGEIRCELIEVDRHSDVKYDAISYHWGSGEKREPITIDGKNYLVSRTVVEVLYHLSSYGEERLVWIDSICINQVDKIEKSSQISIMRNIYINAATTYIWLDGIDEPWKVRTMLAGISYEHMFGTTESTLALLRQHSETWAEQGWAQLMNMFANPYFFRVWVLQEVIMSSSITILASGEPLVWEHIATLANMLSTLPFNLILQSGVAPGVKDNFPQGLSNANIMAHLGKLRQTFQPSLPYLLGFSTDFQSTEAVDKVFGLLGLLSPEDDVHKWMVTDYSMSPSELYVFTAQHLIPDYANDILSYGGIGYRRNIQDLPSWAPDWTSLAMTETYRQHFTKTHHATQYRASADSEVEVTFLEEERTRPAIMRILGHSFDKIAIVGPVLTYTEHNFGAGPQIDVLRNVVKDHMRARKLANIHLRQPYPTGESTEEVFWRSLIGNTQFDRPVPPDLGVFCRVWERMLIAEVGSDDEELQDDTNTIPTLEQLEIHGLKEEAARGALTWNSSRIMCCTGRAFCITENGYVAMTPPGTVAGDLVCVLNGLHTPFILRETEPRLTQYRTVQLVGETYVHGMMDGEAMLVDPLEIEHFDVI